MLYATERQTLCTGLRVCPRVNPAEPGRGRGDNAQITDSLKLGTNVRHQELTYVAEYQVKILNSPGDPGSPCKNRHFACFMHACF